MPKDLGSNPADGMGVCKCTVLAWHGGTLNSRLAASLLVRLVEEEDMCEATYHHQSVLLQNWGWNRAKIVLSPTWCSKVWLTTDVLLALCQDGFREPQSDNVRQVAFAATTEYF
ncbi:hypothetical protein TNCV_7801 [Trichonephila clavipes]|nr:hypothetical protein TNCV_7801 [Trichonephila clavipes]